MKLVLIAALFLSSSAVPCQIMVSPAPLESRIDEADAVCVCALVRPAGGYQVGASPKPSSTYTVIAYRAYKGLKDGESIQVAPDGARIALTNNIRYILLLSHSRSNHGFLLLDAIPVPGDFPLASASGDHLSLENDLSEYLLADPHKANPTEIENVINVLDQYKRLSANSVRALTGLTTSVDDHVALLSMSALLKRNTDVINLFPLFLSKLETIPPDQYPDMGDVSFIFMQNAQPAEIDDFEKLAKSPNLGVQHAALHALGKVADLSTTSFLIKELDASDTNSQYIALITLAELHGKTGDYGPGLGQFQQDKEKYIQLWKEWYGSLKN